MQQGDGGEDSATERRGFGDGEEKIRLMEARVRM